MYEQLTNIHPWLPAIAGVGLLIAAAVLSDLVIRRGLLAIVNLVSSRSSFQWRDVLKRHKVFSRVTHVIPAIVIHTGVTFVPDLEDRAVEVTQQVAMAYVALTITLAIAAALSAANDAYETYPVARARPLKGIVQILQLLVFIVGAAIVISNLIGKSPLIFLSGFGAMTAVLLVVFKDTILGFVASLQLTANDMVRVGDWIEMPAYGADGDVIEVALHTVKIQNFDKTITTIPTYKLIADSFKNWRGMTAAGGRRIKRPVYIDQSSIRFLSDEEIEKLSEFALLREHFDSKRRELEEAAGKLGDAGRFAVNRRRLTNVGVFRAYIRNYLREHAQLHSDMTLLVRQLPPGPDGLPIEIYCFTRTTNWGEYEDVQSDIFDHILAILPEFGLRLFQKPAGTDLANLAKAKATA
jgi:miniconductance mechanosensitive channel